MTTPFLLLYGREDKEKKMRSVVEDIYVKAEGDEVRGSKGKREGVNGRKGAEMNVSDGRKGAGMNVSDGRKLSRERVSGDGSEKSI